MKSTYCSYLNEHTPLYTLEVNGTDGTAVYVLDHGRLSLQLKEDNRSDSFTYQAGTWDSYKFEHALWGGGSLPQVHQDFVHALLAGKPFDIGGDAGSRAIRVVEATRKAVLTEKRIRIN